MRKKVLLFVSIPAILLLGAYLYTRLSTASAIRKEEKQTGLVLPTPDTLGGKKVSAVDLRPLFVKRLQQLLKRSSNGLYDLSIKNLEPDLLASTLTLQGVELKPDAGVLDSLKKLNKLPADVFTISFDSLRVEGINLDDAISSKTMDYKFIKLAKPVITIHHKKRGAKKDAVEEDFSQRFLSGMEKLAIKQLVIEDGTVNLYSDTKKGAPNRLKHVAVRLNNLLLDSTTRTQKNRFLFAESATVSFRDYNRPTPDGLYNMKIGTVSIKAPQDNITLTDFSFTSPLNRTEFVRRQKKSKELYQVRFPAVTLSKVGWWELLNEEELVADALATEGGRLSIFLDRSLPPRNKMGNFPNQLLMKMPLKMNIARAAMRNLDFSYAEYNPLSRQTGTMYMDKVSIQMANLSNEIRSRPAPLTVKGTALLMHQVPVQAQFSFDMGAYKTGAFTAQIKSKGFQGSLLNAFTVPMGMMKIEKGELQSAEATMNGDEQKAAGNVFIPYNDLKIALLEKDKGKKGLNEKHVTTLLANLFVIKDDNLKKGKEPRREEAEFVRIPEGGFFMLVWKTFLVGALKTIGAPTKIAYKQTGAAKKK